jgi:hypothetical protein
VITTALLYYSLFNLYLHVHPNINNCWIVTTMKFRRVLKNSILDNKQDAQNFAQSDNHLAINLQSLKPKQARITITLC